MNAHNADKDAPAPRITAVVVHVTCDACVLDDEFEFEPGDIKAGVEISAPCACDRRVAVTADASAHYVIEPRHNHDAIGVYGNCPACGTVIPPAVSEAS